MMHSKLQTAILAGTLPFVTHEYTRAGQPTAEELSKVVPKWRSDVSGIDVDAEHELIQQKKSKLPASKRRAVEYAWKRMNNPHDDA